MKRLASLILALAACSGPSKPGPVAVDPTGGGGGNEGGGGGGGDGAGQGSPSGAVDARPDVPAGADAARDAELAKAAAGYVDAFTNAEAVLTRDGKRVVFVSNRDGLPQLYVADVDQPAAPPRRLVTSTERVAGLVTTADGKAVLFRSDRGADENWSIFRVGLDGQGLTELTPGGALNRDAFVVPDRAPDTMYFSARAMSSATSTVYAAPVNAAGAARALYTSDTPAFLTDVSPDGKRLAVLLYPSRLENHLVIVDVATGKATEVYPGTGKQASVFDGRFSPDGKRIYVATDGGSEQAAVLALDATTGKVAATHAIVPATALLGSLTVAPKGNLVAAGVVAGNHTEIRLLDGGKLTLKAKVTMPLGTGAANEFSQDGKRLTATWSTPGVPSDLYSIDTRTGKVTPLRTEPRPTLAAMPAIDVASVEIPAFDGGVIPANVYRPGGDDKTARRPVLVVYHGGPSGTSLIRWSAANAFYLALGYAIVEPNVRGSSGFGRAYEAADNGPRRLDAFKDIETSARWVAAQPWADPDRLVVYGGSYGGYTVLVALSRWPDIWKAGVNLFGVVNLDTFMKSTSGVIRQIFLVEFGDPAKDAEFLAQISPYTDADKIVDPTFVYAGANDPRVPRSESDLIVRKLRAGGVRTEYMVADDEGHSLARRPNQIAFYARVARFLEQHLR